MNVDQCMIAAKTMNQTLACLRRHGLQVCAENTVMMDSLHVCTSLASRHVLFRQKLAQNLK